MTFFSGGLAAGRPAPYLLAALALGAALSLGPGQAGAECAEDAARKIFEAGKGYYDTGYYDDALRSFRRAFEVCPKSAMLLNIGAAEEKLGNLQAAVDAYEQYLKMDPEAQDRDAIQMRVRNLRKRIASQPAPAASASAAPASSSAAPPPPPPPVDGGAIAPAAREPSRLPSFVLFGVAGAAAAGAAVTGLVARGRYNDAESSCSPRCSDDDVKGIKSMALVSTILTGVAVVSAGAGAVLWFTSGPASAETKTGQKGFRGVTGGVGPQAAKLEASWAF